MKYNIDNDSSLTIGDFVNNKGLKYDGSNFYVKGNITATSLTIVDSNGNDAVGSWIGTYISSETIWTGVKTATGARNLVLNDTGIRLNSGNTTNMELTNGGITMTAGLINLTGTSYLYLASGNSNITLNSSGITISGANFSVTTTPLTINSSPSSGDYVINSNSKFMVDDEGNVYLKSVKVLNDQGDGYTTIDLTRNFKQAVSLSLAVNGNNILASANFWGQLNTSITKGVTFTLESVERGQSYAAGHCDIIVKCKVNIADGSISSGELTGFAVDVYDIEAAGWNAAARSIRYTSGSKTITVPAEGNYGAGQYSTTSYNISATYDAGYDACRDDLHLPSGTYYYVGGTYYSNVYDANGNDLGEARVGVTSYLA